MHLSTHSIVELMARYPLLGGAFGLVLALMFGSLGIASWQKLQTMPEEPVQLSLAQAAAAVQSGQDKWVTIDNVTWDCDNIVQENNRAEAVFTDETRSVLGVATISTSGDLTCQDLDPNAMTGTL